MKDVPGETFVTAIQTLLKEAYVRPADAGGTWFVDNEPDAGFLGTLEAVSYQEAVRNVPGVDGGSIAAHAAHVRYALSLANRAYKGEDPYANADWPGSWPSDNPDESNWRELLDGLRDEYTLLEQNVAAVQTWNEIPMLTGTIALVAHGAWHLGAVRQILKMMRTI